MTDPVTESTPAVSAKPFPVRLVLQHTAFWAFIVGIASVALVGGLVLRRWAWDQTEPIRYVADINNAFRQGTYTLQSGFIERYDLQECTADRNPVMALDYAPGRLAVATLWTWWVRNQVQPVQTRDGDFSDWSQEFYYFARSQNRQYELCEPLLMVNVAGELLSALAMFFLVRRYTMGKPPNHRPRRGAILGLVAACFFWFNPALISNAHCWPQWDSWVMPFFLWGVLLASLDWWFCSGLVLAAGSMFKAQILFGAPLFILWPLFQGRIPAIARWIAGLLSGAAAVVAVWVVRAPGKMSEGEYIPSHINPLAIAWLIYLALLLVAMVPLLIWPKTRRARIPVGIAVACVITWIIGAYTGHVFSVAAFIVLGFAGVMVDQTWENWNWRARMPLGWIAIAVLIYPAYALAKDWFIETTVATVAVGLLIALAPRRVIPYVALGWIAAGVLMCVPIFNTSKGWFERGFVFGTHHHEKMASEDNNNLAELLKNRWGWDDLMEPVLKLPKGALSDSIAHFLTNVDPGVHKNRVEGPEKPAAVVGEDSEDRAEFVHLKAGEVGLPLKYALLSVWIVSIILCAIGTAIQDRRRSPRFLASIAAPWIMFFAVMTQMHQRYLLWGSSISAATAVINPGYALLHLFLSVVSMGQEMSSMMNNHLDWSHPVNYTDNAMYEFFQRWHPGVSWAVLLTACIFVYTSVKWDRKSPKSETGNPNEAIFIAETQRHEKGN